MYQSFDPFEYVNYLRRRWRVVVLACVAAVVVSLAVSLLLPKRYTATATVVIDPPAGADARTATAVSPVYLESLKSYERYADSDTLFARAAEHFHLLTSGSPQSIESLKHGALKVSKLRDTKIMEISVTLRDPKLAQNVAQFIAEEAVALSHGESAEADRQLAGGPEKQAGGAQAALGLAQKALLDQARTAPVEALQSDVDASVQLLQKVREQLLGAEADVAEYQQSPQDGSFAREQLQAARARVAVLEKRSQELQRSVQENQKILAGRIARTDQLLAELKSAQTASEGAARSLRDSLAAAGTRAERLRVLDPGIVPQRPSSPNIPLNVAAALFLALVASVMYLSFAFALQRREMGALSYSTRS
jgi:polysaccharide biosynthesis transport protein